MVPPLIVKNEVVLVKPKLGDADEVLPTVLTFITPFDRREIRELAMALDDIIDFMEDIPQSSKIYGHSSFTPEMVALGQILLRAAEKYVML